MKKKKILVIDDNKDILLATSLILESEGYAVSTSEKTDVLDLLTNSTKPDLILLDLFVCGKNSKKLTNRLKSQKSTCQIPIILISAYSDIRRSARLCGADGFLSKPFEINQLISAVKKFTDC